MPRSCSEYKSRKHRTIAAADKLLKDAQKHKDARFKPDGVCGESSEFQISRSPLTFNRLSTISVYGLSVREQRRVLLSFQ